MISAGTIRTQEPYVGLFVSCRPSHLSIPYVLPESLPSCTPPVVVVMPARRPPYVCHCTVFNCRAQQHPEEGIGVVPGRVLSRVVYHDHQQQEAQVQSRQQAPVESAEDPPGSSIDVSKSHHVLRCIH